MRNAPELCGSGKGPLIADKLARAPHRTPSAPHPLPGPSGRNAALCRTAAAPGGGAKRGAGSAPRHRTKRPSPAGATETPGVGAVPPAPRGAGRRGCPGGARTAGPGAGGVRSSRSAPGCLHSILSFGPTANFRRSKNRKRRIECVCVCARVRRGKTRAFQPAGRRNVYFFSLNAPNFSTQLKIIKCIKKAGMQLSRAQLLNNSSSAAPISLINPGI